MSPMTTRKMINGKLNELHDGTLDRTLRQQLLKTLTLLLVSMLGQFTFATDVDLYRGLLFCIKDQTNIEGNETRKTTYALGKAFDGSFSNSLDGVALPAKGSISFTLAFSFKVGKQDCLNRILRIGAHRHFYVDADNRLCSAIPVGSGTVYKEFKSSLVVRENAWYSMVLRQDDDNHVYLFAGEKDAELGCVADYEDSKILEIDSANISMGTIVFGSCNYPSAGNLQSGQFANIRFWTRALTNDECVMADKCQNVILETKQRGCPSDVKYDFFPLGGNMFGVDESGVTPKKASSYKVSSSGWRTGAGRLSSTGYAMSSDGGGRIVYADFSELFGTTVFGERFTNTSYSYQHDNYGLYKEIRSSYPDKPYISYGSATNASYVFWLRVDRFPDSVSHAIFSRNIRDSLASKFPEDKEVCLKVNPEGKLVVRQNGEDTTLGGACVRIGEWALISVIGHAKGGITVFVNNVKAGSVSSPITLGAFCGIDTRWKKTTQSFYYTGTYTQNGNVRTADIHWCDDVTSSSGGEATRPITDMTIGGWNGAIDEIAFYGKALSVDEVTEIYEASCPPDSYTSINPTTRNFSTSGGGGAIITSGSSETWRARVSEPWITLNANNGNIGYPVAYAISATTNAEQRIGFVYINGHVHTVTQDGAGGTIASNGATFEHEGGTDTIAIEVQNGIAWKATPNVGWLSVSQRSGIGSGSVLYRALPYDEVATRQGTLTVAGNTFTVFQYGRRMKLDSYSTTQNYEAHVIPITVNALDTTQWSVTPNNGWISIVDGGNGKGGDLVTIAIAENPSYKERTGTVTIGTETFTVTQQGRPTAVLSFNVSPTSSAASVDGANGLVSVTATPDLPWTATSGANWLTIYAATANGAGDGNVVYVASPNPTLSKRTGKITVTPEASSGMTAKSHTVTQPAAQSSLSIGGYEFEVSGEPCSVEVSCADIVQWSVSESLDWLTVNGSTSRTGPGTVVLQAAANNTVYPRSGTVTIAGKAFTVSQKARGVEIEYDSMLFDTDGGYESISIHPDGNSAWTAVASDPTWITIFQGDSGTGDGEILYIVAPYVGDGSARTGWITVGDKKVYITQRPYDLSISPNGAVVKGNSGAGEFGVSANIGAVWNAIVTEPWIALVSGYDAGAGSGIVRFICEDNNTGKPRVGKIVVAGEVYTVTQSARILVQIQATAGRGGSLTGSGTYDKGEKVVLTAVPDSGYRFVRWTGPVESTDNPFVMDADDMSGIRAEFEPMPIEFTTIRSSPDGVYLAWKSLAWATSYRLLRGSSDDASAAEELATFLSGVVDAYCDETGDIGVTHWYWVEAVGALDRVVSESVTGMRKPIVNSPITYTNLNGARHSNPDTYVEGRSMTFSNPSARTGYTFTGWTPARITEEMTGAQTVRAQWAPNTYVVTYRPGANGSGLQRTATKTHGIALKLSGVIFTRSGYTQTGWATSDGGVKAYDLGAAYTANAAVTLYPYWERAKVQLWANGPYWATTNIGADEPEDSGNYFWWGDTVGYKREGGAWVASDGSSLNFKFGDDPISEQTCGKSISTLRSEGWIVSRNGAYVLAPEHDAAHVKWGGDWRMPTDKELLGLENNCDWTWRTKNGVDGYEIRGRGNYDSNSIFLPAVGMSGDTSVLGPGSYGFYWSSTPHLDDYFSWFLYFYSFDSGDHCTSETFCFNGLPVRPVQGFVAPVKVTFGKNSGTGGDNYVTATYGNPMPSPRTAPKQSGWTFAGYWDTLAMDEKGNAKGKQYYDANMKSVRNWDKKNATTLWAKWTNKVTFGKNGGTGGDNYVTCTKGQPMPKRTMPTKLGYTFAGYWNTTGAGGVKYYNADGTSAHTWDKSGSVTLWAKWEQIPPVKVTFGKNGGTGGDNYVTATYGKAMPTPRTAPKRSGWTFAGYWDTLAQDANGNPKGKQYYDVNMKSVRSWDKTSAATLWAKWTVRVKLGKNGGTGGDDYVTVTYNQPFPKRTMPKRTGYAFGGYFVSSSKKTGQCYNTDGTGTASMKWSTGGTPTVWALWTKTSSCVEVALQTAALSAAPSATKADATIPAGMYSGVLADGKGTFYILLDEQEDGVGRTAFLYIATEDDIVAAECTVEEVDGLLMLTTDDGETYAVDPVAGILRMYSVK